jgi:plasmid stability protein
MKTLKVEELPNHVYARLERSARRDGVSVEDVARGILVQHVVDQMCRLPDPVVRKGGLAFALRTVSAGGLERRRAHRARVLAAAKRAGLTVAEYLGSQIPARDLPRLPEAASCRA